VYDRYLWPLVLSGSILVLHRARPHGREANPRVRVVRWAVVALVAFVALALTADADAFDGARWRAGERAVARGVPATEVDAGFEWVGAHTSAVADLNRPPAPPDRYRTWWASMFLSPTICVVVSASPLTDPRLSLVSTSRWRPFLLFGSSRLYEYATAEPGCPAR
jgi:hypothetical protein